MKKIIAMVLAATALPLMAAEVSFEDNTVSAEGYATLYVLPDMAVINFTIEVREPRMGNLFKEAMAHVEELSKELDKLGVKEPLVTEGSGSIYSELDWESERLEHELSIGMRCVVTDLDMLDKVVGMIYELPSKTPDRKVSFYDIMCTVKDPSVYSSQLQEKAFEEAKETAEQAAAAHGRSIGDLIRYSYSPPWTGYMWGPQEAWEFDAEDVGGASVLPRIAVSYSVIVAYELQ